MLGCGDLARLGQALEASECLARQHAGYHVQQLRCYLAEHTAGRDESEPEPPLRSLIGGCGAEADRAFVGHLRPRE